MPKESEKKVSIVVPIYNQEQYLRKTLPTILEQTYKDLEVILVNDGSEDGSLGIINEFQKKDVRIKIINKGNGGLVDATATGIEKATGDYIAFMDPDDQIGKDFIEVFIKNIGKCDFVAAGIFYDNNGEIQKKYLNYDRFFDKSEIAWLRTHYLLLEGESQVSSIILQTRCNKMYKLSCVKKMLPEYSAHKEVTLGEDSIFTYLFLKYCNSGKVMREPNSYYYNISNQNSMMKTTAFTNRLDKARTIYNLYVNMMSQNHELNKQPFMVYLMFTETLLRKKEGQTTEEYNEVFEILHHDKLFNESLSVLIKNEKRLKRKMSLIMKKYIKNPYIYRMLFKCM